MTRRIWILRFLFTFVNPNRWLGCPEHEISSVSKRVKLYFRFPFPDLSQLLEKIIS